MGDICNANQIKSYPTLKGFASTKVDVYKGDKTIPTLTKWASDMLSSNNLGVNAISVEDSNPTWQLQNKTMVPAVQIKRKDLAATIFTMLDQLRGRVSGGSLSVDETAALHGWIRRLTTLPGLEMSLLPLL